MLRPHGEGQREAPQEATGTARRTPPISWRGDNQRRHQLNPYITFVQM